MALSKYPTIDIIIPTLNADKVLASCLRPIRSQLYPQSKIRILIIDGGSTDNTLSIARKFKCQIFANPLKTAEAGKAVGLKQATAQYVALIDSDNILPHRHWLTKMITPLETDLDLIGGEPIKFTYRPRAGFIERYSALIGANDPYAYVTGIYDRQNHINYRWTGLQTPFQNFPSFLKIKLSPHQILPTVGANGTVFRTSFLQKYFQGNFLFDIDVITSALNATRKPLYFAKVKQGIIHTYCESSVSKFIRKQNRRLVDYYIYQNQRSFNWSTVNRQSALKFIFYTILIIPSLTETTIGFIHQPDLAWFFHPVACFLTLYIYSKNFLKNKLGLIKPLNRLQWQQ